MRLDRFRLLRAPGIPEGFTIEPRPGVNLVTGPNGIGKTTLRRAIRSLLWPGPGPYEAEATFDMAGRPVGVAREPGGSPRWTGERPYLGPDHLASRYELGLIDLTVSGPDHDLLAREIRRQMAGGFDLAEVGDELFAPGAKTGMNEQKALRAAIGTTREVMATQAGLSDRRDGLAELEDKKAAAKAARDRIGVLTRLRDLATQKGVLVEANDRLADIPATVSKIRDDDPSELAKWRKNERDLAGKISRVESERGTLETKLAELAGTDLDLGLLRKRHLDWRDRQNDWERTHLETEEIRARAETESLPRSSPTRPLTGVGIGLVLLIAALVQPDLLPYPSNMILLAAGAGLMGGGVWSLALLRRDGRKIDPVLEARMALAGATAKLETVGRSRDKAKAAFLATAAGEGPLDDLAQAEQLIEDLDGRRKLRDSLEFESRGKAADLDRFRNDSDAITEQVAALFERLELETGDDAGVALLVDHRSLWERAREDQRDATRNVERLEKEIAAGQDMLMDGETVDLPTERLDELLAEEEQRAATYDDLQAEIARIEADIHQATGGHDLEEALLHRDAARDQLAAAHETVSEAVVGNLLLDQVAREYESNAQPEVFREANRYFAMFTGNRYSLTMAAAADGADRFLAQPIDAVRPRELGELSDGTRAQLLLAVRLAFITCAEGEARPPLFLDDALSSADPERFAAMATGLGELAKTEGRQVFYLTPNPADAGAFQSALRGAGLEEAHTIDLAGIRGLETAADPSVFDPGNLAAPALAPDPSGQSIAHYASALGVPHTDPWSPAGTLHVIHLVGDDLDLVKRLVDAQASTLGRFEMATRTLVAIGDVTEEESARVSACGDVWKAWLEAWHVGRSAPVTKEFLAGSAAVSEKFIERAETVRADVRGDGAALLAALDDGRVKGFRSNKIDQLRTEFEEAGLLDERPTLDEDDCELLVLDRVASHLKSGLLEKEKVRTLVRTFVVIVSAQ